MKRWLKPLLLIAVVSMLGASVKPIQDYWKERNRPEYRTVSISQGEIVATVTATGSLQPVLSVEVGTFVSGPIVGLHVDFNAEVKKDDILAEIDPRLYKANVARDQATLATSRANLDQADANLKQARNNERRAKALRADNENYISDQEMDQYKFNRLSLEAQLEVAKASIKQAEANLENSTTNLNYTHIRSPVDGIVIDRKIEPGQTLQGSFQTPVLFVIAPDMHEEMHILVSVDESDIGHIKKAKRDLSPVRFTVDAYPEEIFEGNISQIRMSSTAAQGVVTYPVMVSAENPELKLMPGMTANITFQIEKSKMVQRVPNSALRYYPDKENVRSEDHSILDGADWTESEEDSDSDSTPSLFSEVEDRNARNQRHVWAVTAQGLKAIEVTTGLSDFKYTELVTGDVQADDLLVTGIKPKE